MRSLIPLLLILCAAGAAGAAAAPARPNIVVIMSDDMGWSDLGCYGGEIDTPNLDRLAAGGLRFTQFYNTARCCPTRASLLTGLYPHQAGVGHMMEDRGHEGYRGDLSPHSVTMAQVLRSAGYRTYATGKWHVTRHMKPKGPKHNWPLQRGFDRFYGTITGGGSFYDPGTLTRDNKMISPFADPEYRPEKYYYTDAISDHAVRFVREHREKSKDRPFFMYVTYTAAHWPMHAPEEEVERYRGRYAEGYEAVRLKRYRRQKQANLIRTGWELSPGAAKWQDAPNKEWEQRRMEVYAAMITRMDRGIGRLAEELKASGQLDNTLLLFLQDNGGCAEPVGSRSRDGIKQHPAAPIYPPIDSAVVRREVIPKQDRDGYPLVMGPGVMPGGPRTYIAYGESWANVSNTPFKEYKHWVHEGGISTPLIAHWPAGIRRRGELESTPGHLIDIMATCVDLSGARYPAELNGSAIRPPEGVSLKPLFEGGSLPPRTIYWEHEGNRAVRSGRWKLVAKGEKGAWELYDMEADRSEMRNLAAAQPERVEQLSMLWDAWAKRALVLPLNPSGDGR